MEFIASVECTPYIMMQLQTILLQEYKLMLTDSLLVVIQNV